MARPLRIAHFLEAARYIVLNPLRTVRPRRFTDWRWSSYPATAGLSPRPPFLTIETLLAAFAPELDVAREGTADSSYGYSLREIAAHLGVSPPPSAAPSPRSNRPTASPAHRRRQKATGLSTCKT